MENLKKSIGAVISLTKLAESSLEDGKVSIIEGAKLAIGTFQLWNAVKNYKELYAEFKALDEAQKTELNDWFAVEFEIKNDEVEFIVEQVFSALLSLSSLVKA